MSVESSIDAMFEELETDPVFMPSRFWRDINTKNFKMLEREGLNNFKRTLTQNYYNWLVVRPTDPQFLHALRTWLRHPSMAPLRTTAEKTIRLQTTLLNEPTSLRWHQRFIYVLFVSLLWDVVCQLDKTDISRTISEPEVGNPIRISRNSRLISQDLANSLVEYNVVAELISEAHGRPRVAEIGAGHGRLAHVFLSSQQGTYFIFDIPPALNVSQWYISEVYKEKRIFRFRHFNTYEEVREQVESADIAFFTANQIRKFPPRYFDVVLSISTLPEMSLEQVTLYLELFQSLSRRHIYLKQWKSWKNPLDRTDIRVEDYVLDAHWTLQMDRTDPINPQFFNRVWRRSA